jgi:uncharacterized protein
MLDILKDQSLPRTALSKGAQIMPRQQLSLIVMHLELAICRLDRDGAIPEWAAQGEFLSITRTPDELSIVCPASVVPEGQPCKRGWRAWRVAGTLDLGAVGVLAALASPLAEAGVSIFAISTHDTDYLLVKDEDMERAGVTLRKAGHQVQ